MIDFLFNPKVRRNQWCWCWEMISKLMVVAPLSFNGGLGLVQF